ncbi:FAD-dependent oxidoreductase [Alkalibacter saccharofermentans]|uniref:NADPH-dependent 2,4-dienoyl-CoA reductase, sulfur reductase n=1 Tax=Alkalibacter saccharofermentans DSM 14828 TaxID=1120975 RepID=A0A1M4YL19_9FIRM|nr:FAD-dependent oxidoreductase [Alkalibacter saccharofermentans]SHF06454.1 NADPH-dependent 2,4-dienoyl-CoA reductase, sulfur reductase [Alkalibacter saccharofermentans DSM 14828]
MRIIVIGAVAAGTSAAAKARRSDESAEITIYEKDEFISYSGCGMPYFIGGEIDNPEKLTPRDPAFFKSKYNIDVLTKHEVLYLNGENKTVKVRNLVTGEEFEDCYDKLVLATGAYSVKPPIEGMDKNNTFSLRNITDMYRIKEYLEESAPSKATIVGSGFIGLELCESFKALGLEVAVVEMLDQVTPGLDEDMAGYVEDHLSENGVEVHTGTSVKEITKEGVILSSGKKIASQMIILATGVRPNTKLAKEAGIHLGDSGGIKVDKKMETNIKDIYACGDCIEHYHVITKKPIYRPLGSTANKTGRIAGENITGGNLEFRGILGTGIFRVFDLAVGQTGLSEKEAKSMGYDVEISHNIKPSRPEYMGGKEIVIKAIADRKTGRVLGVQVIGEDGVDKRVDVFATAITFGAKAEDLFHLDLAYAPPYSTTKDPVMYSGMILDNAISKGRKLLTATQVDALINSGDEYVIIDARVEGQYQKHHIPTAVNIPHNELRERLGEVDKEKIAVTYCNKGVTGNAAQNILICNGFEKVYSVSGGHKTYKRYMEKKKK